MAMPHSERKEACMAHMFVLDSQQLSNPDIIEAADRKQIVLVKIVGDDEVMRKIVRGIMKHAVMPCECQLSLRCNKDFVREYIRMLVSENIEAFENGLACSAKRTKMLCGIVGALMEVGVFRGNAGDMAKRLNFEGSEMQSRRRYINEGRHNKTYIETFSRYCDAIPNYPAELCGRFKNQPDY